MEASYSKAIKLYQEAGMKGDMDGAYFLGLMYKEGTGVEPSLKLSRRWLSLAVILGDEGSKSDMQL